MQLRERLHVRVVRGGDEVVCDGSRHVLVDHPVGRLEQVLPLGHQEVLEPCTPSTTLRMMTMIMRIMGMNVMKTMRATTMMMI